MLQRGTGTSAGHQRGLLVATSGHLNWPPAGTFSWPRTTGRWRRTTSIGSVGVLLCSVRVWRRVKQGEFCRVGLLKHRGPFDADAKAASHGSHLVSFDPRPQSEIED